MKYFASGFEGSINEYATSLRGKRYQQGEQFSHVERRALLLGAYNEAPKTTFLPNLNPIAHEEPLPGTQAAAAKSNPHTAINLPLLLEALEDTPPDLSTEHSKKHPRSRFTVHAVPSTVQKEKKDSDEEDLKAFTAPSSIEERIARYISEDKKKDARCRERYDHFTSYPVKDIPPTASRDEEPRPIARSTKYYPPAKEPSCSHFYVPLLLPDEKDKNRIMAACTFHISHSKKKLTFEELRAVIQCVDDGNDEDLAFFERILKNHAHIKEVDELEKTILWSLIPREGNFLSLKKLALLLKAGASATRKHSGNLSFMDYLNSPLCSLERTNARAAYACCQKLMPANMLNPFA